MAILRLRDADGNIIEVPAIKGDDGVAGKDGADGTSVSIEDISASTEDGGDNVVTFSDGNILTIKNGSKGDNGTPGSDGADGKSAYELAKAVGFEGSVEEWLFTLKGEKGDIGADGISIQSVVFKEKTEEGNIYSILLTNGTSFDFMAPNGPIGANGGPGDNGETPYIKAENWWIGDVDTGVQAVGKDGIAPKLRVNELTNEWEISYDECITWESVGIKATGEQGVPGLPGVQQAPLFANSVAECADTSKVYVLPDGYIYGYIKTTSELPEITYEEATGGYWFGDEWNHLGAFNQNASCCAKRTNVIPVTPGDQLSYKGHASGTPDSVVWLDANKLYINDEKISSASSAAIITVPENVYYAWFGSFEYTTDVNKVALEVSWILCQASSGVYQWTNTGHAFVPADYEDRILSLEQNVSDLKNQEVINADILFGKTIVYDGDSIAASRENNGGGYAKLIAESTGGSYVNQAEGGARLCANEDRHSVVNNLANLPTDGDLYCFEGGINDFWGNTPIGVCNASDYTGELDTATICGALEAIFRYCLSSFVGKPVCFVIVHKVQDTAHTANSNGDTFQDYHDAMVQVCRKYSVPYYDAFSESGLNGWNEKQSSVFLTGNSAGEADGIHPNEEGYRQYYVPQLVTLFRTILAGATIGMSVDLRTGNLDELNTDNKETLVAAINEVNNKTQAKVLEEAQLHAEYGEELATADGWTTDGWTGSFEEGFTHIAGNTNPLVFQMPEATGQKLYQISFKSSVAMSTTNLFVTLGGSEQFELYGQPYNPSIGLGIRSVQDGNLEFIPESTFRGTLTEISVKEIIGTFHGVYDVEDADGNTLFEVRPTKADETDTNISSSNNLFLGRKSGERSTSGTGNVGFGINALRNNTSGFWNCGIGYRSLEGNTVGSRNIAIGYIAMRENITGTRNVAIGTFALNHNITGNKNIAIGADSQDKNVSGSHNVSIGVQSLYANTSGDYNVAVGDSALGSNTAGRNTALGYRALAACTTGSLNVGLGYSAGTSITTGSSNLAIGSNALYKQKTGSQNIGIGIEAGRGQNTTNGFKNGVFIGSQTGYSLSDNADYNIMIGFHAGYDTTTGSNNILIGSYAQTPSATQSKWLNIGNLVQGYMGEVVNAYARICGTLEITNLATSDPGIAGRLWNDNGTVKVSAGI